MCGITQPGPVCAGLPAATLPGCAVHCWHIWPPAPQLSGVISNSVQVSHGTDPNMHCGITETLAALHFEPQV